MEKLIQENNIKNIIYEIRGVQVIFDSDLVKLYQVKTKRINEAVRKNNEKLPDRFSFSFTDNENFNLLVAKCDQKFILIK